MGAPRVRRTGLLAEWVLDPTDGDGETVAITVWPSHEVFDAWIATPYRAGLTAPEVHQAVDYRPVVRYDLTGGHTNLSALVAHLQPTEEQP
jgi:hypothetical protein